jgi:GAF domain-containing protein
MLRKKLGQIAGLLMLGIAFVGYRLRVRNLEVKNSDLERQVNARTKELATLNVVAQTVSHSLKLDDMLAAALEKALEVLAFESGAIYLRDVSTGGLQMACHVGLPSAFRRVVDKGIISLQAAESSSPIIIEDTTKDPIAPREIVQEGFRSVASIPLVSHGEVQGVLTAADRKSRRFRQEDVDLLLSIGHQIGVAIESARLHEGTRNRLAQVTALQKTSTAVASTLELDELLHLITQQATALLQAEGGILNLVDWDKHEDMCVACAGSITSAVGRRARLEEGLSGWVTLHNQPVISNQLGSDGQVDQTVLSRLEIELGKQVRNAAAAPLAIKDQVVGTLVLVDKQSGQAEFDASDLDLLVAFANQAATAIENARLFAAEQRRAEQFRVISEVGRRITSLLDLDSVLNQVVSLVQGSFGYDHVGIALIEDGYATYKVGAGEMWEQPSFEFRPGRLKVGEEGITGWVAAQGKPLLVPDVTLDPRYVWMEGSQTRSELALPITIKDKVVGVLDVQSNHPNAFDESDIVVLQSLADQAAITIENAQLYEQAQKVAVMEERQRLARELHDAVTQTLFSASLIAEALPDLWASDQDEGRALLGELRQLSRGALAEMRTLLLELRPTALVEANLRDLVHQLAEAVTGRTGMPVAVTADDLRHLPEEVHVALYRIAQEALNNVVKHAQAHQVEVSLRCRDTAEEKDTGIQIELSICDDGRGFDLERIPPDHLGLGIIRERAQAIGARLQLASQPGHGTQISVVWKEKP